MSVLRWHLHAQAVLEGHGRPFDLICLIELSHSGKGKNQINEKPPNHQKTAGFEIIFYLKTICCCLSGKKIEYPLPAAAIWPLPTVPQRGWPRLHAPLGLLCQLAFAAIFSVGHLLLAEQPAVASSCVGKAGAPRWRVGVVPQLPPRQTIAAWQPVLTAVGQRSGQCFELVVAGTIPAFEQQLRELRASVRFDLA